MFGYRKARGIVSNATQVFNEAFPQPPTDDEIHHILGLASEAITDGMKALGTL